MWPYGDLPLDRVWFLSFVLNRVHNLRARGVLLGILGGGVPPGSPNPDRFQTWPLGRNYVIIT